MVKFFKNCYAYERVNLHHQPPRLDFGEENIPGINLNKNLKIMATQSNAAKAAKSTVKTTVKTTAKPAAETTQMKNEDIIEQFRELLDTGKVVLIERKPSAKNEGTFDYQFAQQRANAMTPELEAIATLRSEKFKPVIMRTWISSIDAASDQANIDNGLVTFDDDGNFEANIVEGMKIVVREHAGVGKQHVYLNADGEITFSNSRVKRNRDQEIMCTSEGLPIFRETLLAGEDAKDITVPGNTPMEDEDFDSWKDEWLASEQAEEFAAELAEA